MLSNVAFEFNLRRYSVVARVDECQAGVDDERVNRLEREALTLKRVGPRKQFPPRHESPTRI